MMKKIIVILSYIIVILSISTTIYATDLPIDITAIGRQEQASNQMITQRIGANLFTADAQRINELLADQVRQRQESVVYLFAEVSVSDEVDSHMQVMTLANDMALFAQPVNFGSFSTPQADDAIPIWLMVLIFILCAIGGFVFSVMYRNKKRRRTEDVH